MGRRKQPIDETCVPDLRRSALRLFAVHGIEGASVRMISSAAGVSEAALYRHYKGKDELAYDLFLRGIGDLVLRLQVATAREKDSKSKIRALIEAYSRAFDEDPELHGYLIQSQHLMLPRMPKNFPNPRHLMREIVEEGQSTGVFAKGDPELHAAAVIGMIERVSVYHVYRTLPGALSDRATLLVNLVSKALS